MSVTRTSFTTRARTWLLLAGLSGLFVAIGAVIGGAALWLFVFLAIAMNFAAYWMSDKFAIRASRAKEVSPEEAPQLHHMVDELATLYRLPKPRVYLIPSEQPNAFATGRNAKHAAVAVTEGLMAHMPYEQVRGVMAHEFAHIANRDILISSVAAMIAGAVSAIGNMFLWMTMFGGDEDESPLGMVGTLLMVMIAPIAATLLQLAVSRQREFLADATAARVLGEGRPLADALGNLERGRELLPMQVNAGTSSMYIVNPLKGVGVGKLFATHPPIEERIARLRAYDVNRGIG